MQPPRTAPIPPAAPMAEAVGSCRGKKYLVPMNSCGVAVAGVEELPLPAYVARAVEALAAELERDRG